MRIDLRDIHMRLGSSEILKGLDLSIENRQFAGIIGPNGSGKSTLLKCMYRVLQPTAGVIFFGQKSQRAMSVRESAQRLAVVAQHNFYNFDFSVQEVVLMGRSPHKKIMERDNSEDYAIVAEALRTVGMEEFAERNFSSLSGGEQQRVILARALAQKTQCLILDEPTNHLDIKYQLQIMDIVKKLKLTVVAAIHDLNIAAMYCDTVYALKNGRLVGFGKPEEILTEAFIYSLFEVHAHVWKDPQNGRPHIAYCSNI